MTEGYGAYAPPPPERRGSVVRCVISYCCIIQRQHISTCTACSSSTAAATSNCATSLIWTDHLGGSAPAPRDSGLCLPLQSPLVIVSSSPPPPPPPLVYFFTSAERLSSFLSSAGSSAETHVAIHGQEGIEGGANFVLCAACPLASTFTCLHPFGL